MSTSTCVKKFEGWGSGLDYVIFLSEGAWVLNTVDYGGAGWKCQKIDYVISEWPLIIQRLVEIYMWARSKENFTWGPISSLKLLHDWNKMTIQKCCNIYQVNKSTESKVMARNMGQNRIFQWKILGDKHSKDLYISGFSRDRHMF